MKKQILKLLLLFTVLGYSQTNPTSFSKIKVTAATKKNDATRVVVQDSITKEYHWQLKDNFVSDALGYTPENVANKSNVYIVDGTGTKYYTVDYLNAKLSTNYAKIVYVNATNPNSATIFDLNNPPVTNDNSLKTDTNNLYIATDASTWIYDGTLFNYVTKTLAATSNFYLDGSSADAGSNKDADIHRNGNITAGNLSGINTGDQDLSGFQSTLVSGTNIKTINGTSLLGSGDLVISGSSNPFIKSISTFSSESYGDSITFGQGSTAGNSYIELFSSLYGLTNINRAVSARGIWEAARLHNLNINVGNAKTSIVMAGFNDVRRGGNAVKTISKIKNGYRAIIVNQFLNMFIPAKNTGGSIATSGTWLDYFGDVVGGKSNATSGYGGYSSTIGAYKEYTFKGNNVVLGMIGTDGVFETLGNFDVTIDGVLQGNYTGNNKTDGISDGSNDNARAPYILYFGGLTDALHTIRVTVTSANAVAIDYFGNLLLPKFSPPLIFVEAPKMNSAGYATAPALASDAIINELNTELENVVSEFSTEYPIYVAKTNDFYNVTTGISVDNIHPNDTGYRQIYSSIVSATNTLLVQKSASTVSDIAYNATTWDGITDIAPSKNVLRDKIEAINTQITTIISSPISIVSSNSLYSSAINGGIGTTAVKSIMLGNGSGYLSTGATQSNFFGFDSGNSATNANNSNFMGNSAGSSASSANNSNFFGNSTGTGATSASNSNFMGSSSGYGATGASHSNFFGYQSGYSATGASFSNFSGYKAGYTATNATTSNFFGYNAGLGASNASYSNLFGYNAGSFFTGNNIGTNNIIIGLNISLPNATTNAINIGGILYGIGANSSLAGNPSIIPVSGGKIGIGVVNPSEVLEVGGNIKANGTIRLKNYTVATLPTGVQGDTAYVTDATAPTYLGLLIGGGSIVTPVFYNGTAWVSH